MLRKGRKAWEARVEAGRQTLLEALAMVQRVSQGDMMVPGQEGSGGHGGKWEGIWVHFESP